MGFSNYLPSSRIAQPGVCTSTTRPASPFEGQVIYETDTNRVLVYDASAWVMIADTDSPPGMELVKVQTVGSAVASVTVSDAFSSTYDNYRVVYSGGVASQDTGIGIQMAPTSVTNYNSLYYGAVSRVDAGGVASLIAINNQSYWLYGGMASTDTALAEFDLFMPFLSKFTMVRLSWIDSRTSNAWGTGSGVHRVASSFSGFTLITTNGGTFTGGTIRVYGYRNSI